MKYQSNQSRHDAAPRIIGNLIREVQDIVSLHHGEKRPELDRSLAQLQAATQNFIRSRHV